MLGPYRKKFLGSGAALFGDMMIAGRNDIAGNTNWMRRRCGT